MPQMESPWGHPRSREESRDLICQSWYANSIAAEIGEPRGGAYVTAYDVVMARVWAYEATARLWAIVDSFRR